MGGCTVDNVDVKHTPLFVHMFVLLYCYIMAFFHCICSVAIMLSIGLKGSIITKVFFGC
jgi:hypothetical protein